MQKWDPKRMAEDILDGNRRAAARLISLLEEADEDAKSVMKHLYPYTGKGMVVGITGGAGSGKSTLADRLIHAFRGAGQTVGVVVVDPSSPFSGGAFLGDRLRLQRHSRDQGVFIRSMASRGYLGGLARATWETVRVMEAMGMEVILVETIGTGQDEIDIVQVAQTCLLVLTPASGDEIQALKAGLMEIGHIFVLNKFDLDGATQALRAVESAMSIISTANNQWKPRVIRTVATEGDGISELVEAIREHQRFIKGGPALHKLQAQRVEYELGLIFRDTLQRKIFKGLKGTGRKRRYIQEILEGKADPYSVIDEIIGKGLNPN